MKQLEVTVPDGEGAADLREWLSAQGFASTSPGGESMGGSEVVAITLASLAVARAGWPVLQEWIRSRRTTVELTLGQDRFLKVDAGSDPGLVLDAIERFLRDEEAH